MWLSSGWRRRIQPARLLSAWNRGINYLIPFNEHDRNFTWPLDNWMHSVRVPNNDHVNVAGIWAVELFPPADLPALRRSIARNGWDRQRPLGGADAGNRETLARARSGTGTTWWRMASLVRKGSTWFALDGIRTDLPSAFETVQLRAIQVGDGLTAVIAEFHLSDTASNSVDVAWHTKHEPFMRFPRGRRPISYDRHWGTFWKVQSARVALHEEARTWLMDRLPGFFRRHREPHPLLDLLLLDKFDPTRAEPANISRDTSLRRRDAMRALGLDLFYPDQLLADDLPKLILGLPPRAGSYPAMGEASTWSLWGKRDAVMKALGDDALAGYGGDPNRAIAHRLVDRMYNLFVMLAVSDLLSVSAREQARIRDEAANKHGKFKPKALRSLRRSLLTLSLDLTTLRRDVRAFWERDWSWDGDPKFFFTPVGGSRRRNRKAGSDEETRTEFNASVRARQERDFARLVDSDRDLRDILSTVASLGASVDSFRLGRSALWVAVASLAVAIGTMLVAEVGPTSLLGWLLP